MKTKSYGEFELISPKEPGSDGKDQPINEEYFIVITLPISYNSKRWLKERRDKEILIMTVKEVKLAG